MKKIASLAELKKVRDQQRAIIQLRQTGENPEQYVQVKVAMATCGIASGARKTMDFMIEALNKRGIESLVIQTGCMGYCYAEPTVEVTLPGSEPVVYGNVDTRKADEIIEKYIKKGEYVDGIIPVNYETLESYK